ncbi:MAG: S-layer homology domain-containing protein [Desulfamplus sp.]|nr:S-layer homology domain-containing protein [Desulfamplus sp.]
MINIAILTYFHRNMKGLIMNISKYTIIIFLLFSSSLTWGEAFFSSVTTNEQALSNAIYNSQNKKYGSIELGSSSGVPGSIQNITIPIYIPPMISNTNKELIPPAWEVFWTINKSGIDWGWDIFWKFIGGLSGADDSLKCKSPGGQGLFFASAVIDSLDNAMETYDYSITILKSTGAMVYPYIAIIQIDHMKKLFDRAVQEKGILVRSYNNFLCLYGNCDHLKEKWFGTTKYDFAMRFEADENHLSDPYGSYLGIHDSNILIVIPKVYPKDSLIIGPDKISWLPWNWGTDWNLYKHHLSGASLAQGTTMGTKIAKITNDSSVDFILPEDLPHSTDYDLREMKKWKDIVFSDWFAPYLYQLYNARVVEYTTDNFNPAQFITRGQFVAWIVRGTNENYLKQVLIGPINEFDDVPNTHSFYNEIIAARSYGIVSGDGGTNNFRPDGYLNRAEAAKMVSLSLDYVENLPCDNIKYSDVEPADWFCQYVKFLTNRGIIHGYRDGTFKPEKYLNKAEATKIIVEMMNAR